MFFARRAPQHDQTPCPEPSECEVLDTKELTPEEIGWWLTLAERGKPLVCMALPI
jgi:hypothetical protein